MADDGMDPCECFWSHEIAMRRLLSILRQSQTTCTDSECFDQLPGGLPGVQSTPEQNLFLMMVVWAVLALLMFMIRPSSLRNKVDADYRNQDGDDGRPPMPPALN